MSNARRQPPNDAGFSLVELLVAVAILALTAVALLDGQTQAISFTSKLEQRSLASMVAENRMNLVMGVVEPPAPGVRTGQQEQLGVTFGWQETVRPAPGNQLTIVEIVVSSSDPRPTELARLVGFRKAP